MPFAESIRSAPSYPIIDVEASGPGPGPGLHFFKIQYHDAYYILISRILLVISKNIQRYARKYTAQSFANTASTPLTVTPGCSSTPT